MKIKNVTDPEFRRYGRIVDGYDFTEMIKVMADTTSGGGYLCAIG